MSRSEKFLTMRTSEHYERFSIKYPHLICYLDIMIVKFNEWYSEKKYIKKKDMYYKKEEWDNGKIEITGSNVLSDWEIAKTQVGTTEHKFSITDLNLSSEGISDDNVMIMLKEFFCLFDIKILVCTYQFFPSYYVYRLMDLNIYTYATCYYFFNVVNICLVL